MPRQIIDTESSRPRYVRRVAWTIATVFLVIGLLVLAFALHFPGKWSARRVSWEATPL